MHSRPIILLLLYLAFADFVAFPQNCRDSLYLKAYNEIVGMLEGNEPLSIKRAVFMSEWAYLDGNLDYEEDFCRPIREGVEFMEQFILINSLDSFKTAKQIALCDFFFKPWSGNGRKPFMYDFSEEIPIEDWRHQLVSRTLKTHKGRCHSLPFAFKLFAEAIGADVHINKAPAHCYITYEDLDDLFPEEKVNVEVAAQQFHPTWVIKENFEICDSAIIAGTYMTPLTDKQTVANQLADLAFGYFHKHQCYDEFTLACASKSLEYFPMNPNAIIIKAKSLQNLLHLHLYLNGGNADNFTNQIEALLAQCKKDLDATHYTLVTEEMDRRLRSIPQ